MTFQIILGKYWNHCFRGAQASWDGIARDNRRFIKAVFWILRIGAPWRDLPQAYDDWKNTHRRFSRWKDKGIWEKPFKGLIDDPDLEWLMIDASHANGSPACSRSARRQ